MVPRNDAVRSQSLVNVNTGTLASSSSLSIHSSMSTLPIGLIWEILCKLPVKLLIQLKCVCKFWNTLISDPKFAKKHLHASKTYHHHHHLIGRGRDSLIRQSTMSSILSEASTTSVVPQLQLIVPEVINNGLINGLGRLVSSCDGILLFKIDRESNLLWNPSIRKVKILPPLLNTPERYIAPLTFGYDPFIENYKLFAVVGVMSPSTYKNEVSVYTLGTDSWRRIDDFPYDSADVDEIGMFVSGTVNWLTLDGVHSFPLVIVSLDLEESYRTLSTPDLETYPFSLGVLRDCLCIFSMDDVPGEFFDVWVMNEYGIKESWTKLFSVACVGYAYTEVLYVFEDDQMLLSALEGKLVVYNSRNGTLKIPRIPNMNDWKVSNVYVESLISPCSLVKVTTKTLASSSSPSSSIHVPMPTLSIDLIWEILCKLPVKLLIQLKRICKFWNTLISDPKFAKKHLHVSKTYHHHHHLIGRGRDSLIRESTMSSIFSDTSTTSVILQLQLVVPEVINKFGRLVSSCDGILLFKIDGESNLLWNPSIRKVKILPPLLKTSERVIAPLTFGYDPFIENYKLFAVVRVVSPSTYKNEVSVYTLGTDSWRRINDFPYKAHVDGQGMFVSGTVNWLTLDGVHSFPLVIVSLDLEKESYRTLSTPNLETYPFSLGVLRDCLCIFSMDGVPGEFFDVWVMNEYGIKESWTKLFSVARAGYAFREVLYVFEDDQMLLSTLNGKFVVYNSRNGTLKIPWIPNMNDRKVSDVYVESLVSPCS